MTSSSAHSPLVIAFGILGNVVSFVVFLAPVPTFWRIFKKKSTEGFQSVPYVFALFSAMIWIYYAFLKTDEFLLITINAFGCLIETIYISMYITYAPKQARVFALRLLLLVNFGGFCLILLLSHFLAQGPTRVEVLGWVCVAFSVSVFAAPLSIMRVVIRTKSVEFMPFSLSFFLTLSAVMWLFYGLLLKDLYVACPNILGFTFGVAQMILYAIYRNKKTVLVEDQKLPEHKGDVVKQIQILSTTPEVEIKVQAVAVSPHVNTDNENCEQTKDQYVHPQTCNTEKILGPSMPSQMVTCEV
ncbi:PREDICTED: bidirectional sugar transporter [Prunus dulcis]|uniref:Bidirectional sugar transporter SWEET n=1 Tax=Prunus dulcis TaxID=3755 RepID=A0A5E4F0W0_PRUDU|nr:bidirectional sugar transporter N3-like [Prunus dulcis]KAI5329480.1 hypothetical protein L3X38_028877 [Prunus dulcis]VVA21685.1 PREDICTED: bidirectional sugar transporter [Prunus dulcis]